MQRSIAPLLATVTVALSACGPVPGLGLLFGPDSSTTILFFLGVIGLFAYGVKRLRERNTDWGPGAEGGHGRHGEPAIQILRERYAKGEISRSEYLQSLNDLAQN